MKDFNVVVVSGRLGRDPELKNLNEKTSVVDFSIANAQDYFDKNKNEWVNKTNWVAVKAFSPFSEYIQKNYHKGNHVMITGELREESWETKDGEKRSRVVVYANKIMSMEGTTKKEDSQAPTGEGYSTQEYAPYDAALDEDIF